MLREFRWLAVAAVPVVAAACESIWSPTAPEPRFFASVEGARVHEYTGSGHFYAGRLPRRPPGIGPQLFTIESHGIGAARGILVQLTRTGPEIPEPGVYAIGAGEAEFRVQLSYLSSRGATLESFMGEAGELVITRATPNTIEGTFRFDAVRRCQSLNGGGSVVCSAGAAPPDAPRVSLVGEFEAVPAP
jgi:hypothetical protein